MEGESRKRKQENNEEESEEEKMEKFFALVRSTKDVRDRLSNSKEKEDKKDDEKEKGSWKPRFEPEDFMDFQGLGMGWSTHNLSNPSHASSSSSANPKQVETQTPPQNEDKYEKASDHLDLTLSL